METEEDLSFIDYVNIYHRDVAIEYVAYRNRFNLPEIGERIVTLVSGYGGSKGLIRKVIGFDKKYIKLSGDNLTFACSIKDWYKEIRVIE